MPHSLRSGSAGPRASARSTRATARRPPATRRPPGPTGYTSHWAAWPTRRGGASWAGYRPARVTKRFASSSSSSSSPP
eukprot:1189149-Pyramimonas_sp.AAC.1